MAKETTILDCYTDTIESLHGEVDADGRVHIARPDGELIPAVIEEKPLYLPIKKVMNTPGIMDKNQVFHPLSESLPRKTISPVMAYLQKQATWVIAYYVTTISRRILETAADPALHAELPPDAGEFLKRLSNANDKTVKKLEQLIRKASQKNRLVSVYCKSGGKFQGSPVTRMCTIRFPVMDMLETGDTKELKVSFSSNKERETIKQLFHYVLPMGDDPEQYSDYSNGKIAPFFEAFLKAYEKIVTQLNKMVARHGDTLGMGLEPIPTKAFKHLSKLPTYFSNSLLPTIEGNEGGIQEMQAANRSQPKSDQPSVESPQTPTSPQQTTSPQYAPTTQKHTPAPSTATDMDSFMSSLRGTQNQPSYQQPQHMPYPGQYQQPTPPPMHNPYAAVLHGGYGTPQPQAPQAHYTPGQHRHQQQAGYGPQVQYPPQQGGYPPQQYPQQGGYPPQGGQPPWNDTGSL